MVAYNFSAQFADLVAAGRKNQTVRALGKRRHARPGDPLQLYTGQRTRHCVLLREAICVDVRPIRIVTSWHSWPLIMFGDGDHLPRAEAERFAAADGFASAGEMHAWLARHHGMPFCGVAVYW